MKKILITLALFTSSVLLASNGSCALNHESEIIHNKEESTIKLFFSELTSTMNCWSHDVLLGGNFDEEVHSLSFFHKNSEDVNLFVVFKVYEGGELIKETEKKTFNIRTSGGRTGEVPLGIPKLEEEQSLTMSLTISSKGDFLFDSFTKHYHDSVRLDPLMQMEIRSNLKKQKEIYIDKQAEEYRHHWKREIESRGHTGNLGDY